MTSTEYRKFKKHILDHMESKENLKTAIGHYGKLSESKGNFWITIDKMCQYNLFDVHYDQCLDTFKEIYGDKFDESKYITKDKHWRYKSNEVYIWLVYKAKIAKTIQIMMERGEI